MRRVVGMVNALPADSRTNADDPKMPWNTDRELLATLVEEVSRLTRENPLEVERPTRDGDQPRRPARPTPTPTAPEGPKAGTLTKTPTGGMVANGFDAMIQLAAQRGHVAGSSA